MEGEGFVVEVEGEEGEEWPLDEENMNVVIYGGVGRKVSHDVRVTNGCGS